MYQINIKMVRDFIDANWPYEDLYFCTKHNCQHANSHTDCTCHTSQGLSCIVKRVNPANLSKLTKAVEIIHHEDD